MYATGGINHIENHIVERGTTAIYMLLYYYCYYNKSVKIKKAFQNTSERFSIEFAFYLAFQTKMEGALNF